MAARYVLSLCAAALVTGILMEVNREGAAGQLMKPLCGVFLMLTALGPLGKLELPELPELSQWDDSWQEEAAKAVEAGQAYATKKRQTDISGKLTEYIMDKAAGLGLDLQAQVTLSEDDTPKNAELRASPTDDQKQAMETYLWSELGIPKEAVRWMEP